MKFYYTYLLYSHKDNDLYSGYSVDLKNRFKEHMNGKVFSTKSRLPVKLIYYEACLNEDDAIRREKYFKSGKGKKFLKKRLKRFFESRSGFGPETGTP